MTNIQMPNFTQWADYIYSGALDVESSLRQAFEQGKNLGSREALCSNQEWWKDQDVDQAWIQSHDDIPTEE